MPKNKFFMICYGIILVLLIIWLMTKVQFIFYPVKIAIQTLFIPFFLAGVMYYLFRPLVDFLQDKKIPRVLGILLVYLLLIGVLVSLSIIIGPVLQNQVNRLIENAPAIADAFKKQWDLFQHNRASFPDYITDAIDYLTLKAQEILAGIGTHLASLFGVIANIVVILVVIPFILFYMLKDGKKAPDQLLSLLPNEGRREGKAILSDMNKALSTYVQGQFIVCLCVGIMVYIGYLIIGLEYSLILAIVAMLTNVIPFVGPFIGIIPALIVAFIDSPMMVVKVIIVVVLAQQIESSVVSPQIMGRALNVHPLTIILLLLVAASLGGILGLILAVPTYAVLKVTIRHLYRLIRLRYKLIKDE